MAGFYCMGQGGWLYHRSYICIMLPLYHGRNSLHGRNLCMIQESERVESAKDAEPWWQFFRFHDLIDQNGYHCWQLRHHGCRSISHAFCELHRSMQKMPLPPGFLQRVMSKDGPPLRPLKSLPSGLLIERVASLYCCEKQMMQLWRTNLFIIHDCNMKAARNLLNNWVSRE